MSSSKLRRDSVEWAQWTHEQNMEALQGLKRAAAGQKTADGNPVDRSPKISSGDGRLKMMQRKNKSAQEYSSGHGDGKSVVAENHQPFSDVGVSSGATSGIDNAEAEIFRLRSERELLLQDQAKLVEIIKNDNFKLMDILNVTDPLTCFRGLMLIRVNNRRLSHQK
jgi:hypothetical protein